MKNLNTLLSGLVVILLSLESNAADTQASAINKDIDKLTQTWLTTEQSTDKLVSDWQLEKQLINQRISILKQQNKQLNKTVNQTNNDADELTLRRQNLVAEQGKVEQLLADYKQVLPKFTHAMQSKAAKVPEHLQQQLKDTLAKLSASQPLTAQYQTLVDTLKQWHKNDQLLQVKQGMIKVAGQDLMTEQVYLGNDQAWFSTPDNSRVGLGFATQSGWLWQELSGENEQFSGSYQQAIAQAIKDAKNLTPGRLIDLPVKLENVK